RVRRRIGGVAPHPRRDQHHAASHRDSLQRVQLRGRLRGRVAAHVPRAGDAGGEDAHRMAAARGLTAESSSEGPMAGYSSRSLADKLGIKPGTTVTALAAPPAYVSLL